MNSFVSIVAEAITSRGTLEEAAFARLTRALAELPDAKLLNAVRSLVGFAALIERKLRKRELAERILELCMTAESRLEVVAGAKIDARKEARRAFETFSARMPE